MQKNVVHFTS